MDRHLRHFLLAKKDGMLVGVIGLEVLGEFGLLRSLAVTFDHRGKGIGNLLNERMLAYARLQGIKQPVFEASRLQDDLRRAGIEPDWWIVNQTWTGIRTTDPVLGKLAGLEAPWQKQVAEKLSRKTVSLPWQAVTPQGRNGLLQLL